MKMLALALVLLATPASAQQPSPPQPPQPSAEIQALQTKLMQELNAALQCTTQSIALGQENTKLKAEIEELKKTAPPTK